MDTIDVTPVEEDIDVLLDAIVSDDGGTASSEEQEVSQPNEDRITIPENSPTLLIEESTSRFSTAVWYDEVKGKSVLLAGLGGIGSYVGFLLSRLRPYKLMLIDGDEVEMSNMSGQLYSRLDASNHSSKVRALERFLGDYSDYLDVYGVFGRYTQQSTPADIMICGFDSMSSRKTFYNSWKRHVLGLEDKSKALFIDGRLAAEEFQVFCIKGDDLYHMEQYEDKWLFSDAEADETVCSYKQTSHCAAMIASVIVNLFVNFVANQCNPIIDRDLPFMTSYDASTIYFKTES